MESETIAPQIKRVLDQKLTLNNLKPNVNQSAIQIFQQLFVEILNFEIVSDPFGGIGESVPVANWNKLSKVESAKIIAESHGYRVIYIELEKVTRTAERFAVSSLTSEGWAQKGEFIAIFHSSGSDIWNLVSPYVEPDRELGETRTVLRRYIVGEGETHRTVSRNLAKMDASLPSPLFERIEEAFQLKPVTEGFYDDYKEVFNLLTDKIADQDANIADAKTYAHLLLNRLMFLFFIQKKGWLNDDKNFMEWYLEKYEGSGEEDNFHNKWLNKLFFYAMNKPPEEKDVSTGFPDEVCRALNSIPYLNGGLFEEKDVDLLEPELSDAVLNQVIRGFLENYNFTVTEESPFDKDVAVDPAMLGKIYESLIAEQERGKAGIFYTPRVEVDLMCRLGLYEYLAEDRDEDLEGMENSSLIKELTSDENREELIEFLFTPLEKWDFGGTDRFKPLRELLDRAKIVDPACGSGAFLVGMMQVYADLYRKMGIEPNYHSKEMIVNNNLHGVDIKDWAVRMAEFRLWLSLIESEEELPDEEPVLPNFSFKLHVGDSIVQKLGNEQVSFNFIKESKTIPQKIKNKVKTEIDKLKTLKKRYFSGEKDLLGKVKRKQVDILKYYIGLMIQLLQEKKDKKQLSLLKEDLTKEEKKKTENYEKQIKTFEEEKIQLLETKEQGLFSWDLDFAEVMLNGGFDIVIANPPYVRQEKIIRQDIDPEILKDYSNSKVKKLKKQYKNDLIDYVNSTYNLRMGKRSDLYIYFFFKGLELLNANGNLVYITSNSWLDVKFGKYLQKFLCKYVSIKNIFNNKSQRSFEEADVNTIISVFGKQELHKKNFANFEEITSKWPKLEHKAKFINFKKPYYESINLRSIVEVEEGNSYDKIIELNSLKFSIFNSDKLRKVKISQRSLLEDGWDYPQGYNGDPFKNGKYKGNKWGGKFLRAPDIFFECLVSARENVSQISDLGHLRRGLTTGINDFFYIEKDSEWAKKIEDKYLIPAVKSAKDFYKYFLKKEDTKKLLFSCDRTKKELEKLSDIGALKYIENSKNKTNRFGTKYPDITSVQNKDKWYALDGKERADILCNRFYSERFFYGLIEEEIADDQTFYGLVLEDEDRTFIASLLNSSLQILFTELLGRVSLGEGVLQYAVYETGENYIYIPKNVKRDKLIKKGKKLMQNDIYSIFEEFGIDKKKPIREQEPDPLPARKELDDIMFDALDLSDQERKEVYWAVAELVKSRLEKAQSV